MSTAPHVCKFVSLSVFTAIAVLSLSQSATADEPGHRYTEAALNAMLADAPVTEQSADSILPSRLMDENELREAHMISVIDVLPQGRLGQKEPFIDFSKFEMGAFAGFVDYSSDFKANASYVAGVTARVPVPGLPLGEWGIWAEAMISYISRDLPYYYNSQSGNWFGLAVGGDYTFLRQEKFFLRGQLGVLYANWNGINSLDDGAGIFVGAQFAWYWIRGNDKAVLTFTPQFTYDGTSWIGMLTFGFSVDF